jgi:hypothetical protein
MKYNERKAGHKEKGSQAIPSSPVGKLPFEWVGIAITFYHRIREIFGSKLDRDTGYTE